MTPRSTCPVPTTRTSRRRFLRPARPRRLPPSWTATWPISRPARPRIGTNCWRTIPSWPRSSKPAWPASSSSTAPPDQPLRSRPPWASSGSFASSAGAAWAWSTRPSRPRSGGRSLRKSCGSAWWPTRKRCNGFAARPRPWRGCTTPTSCRSSPSAASGACITMRCSSSRAAAWPTSWRRVSGRKGPWRLRTSPDGAFRRPRPWPMPTSAG